MIKIIIKNENLATRCEICHQSDYFNPETGDCLRCSIVQSSNKEKFQTKYEFKKNKSYEPMMLNLEALKIYPQTIFLLLFLSWVIFSYSGLVFQTILTYSIFILLEIAIIFVGFISFLTKLYEDKSEVKFKIVDHFITFIYLIVSFGIFIIFAIQAPEYFYMIFYR